MWKNVKARAAAIGLGALVAFGASSAVSNCAEAQAARAANEPSIRYSSNARRDAWLWSTRNPTGAAVAVYLGTSGDLPPSVIDESIRRGFARNNVTNVVFFYEQNDVPATVFSLHENGNGYGPYRAPELRDAISVVSGQVRLVIEHPELAYSRRH